jgi:hypothetical protein
MIAYRLIAHNQSVLGKARRSDSDRIIQCYFSQLALPEAEDYAVVCGIVVV